MPLIDKLQKIVASCITEEQLLSCKNIALILKRQNQGYISEQLMEFIEMHQHSLQCIG